MKVMSYLKDDGACGYYRITLPMTKLAEHTDTDVINIKVGAPIHAIVESLDCDIALLPRVCDDDAIDLIDTLHSCGKKVILDYDDNMFNVSPFSPHYEDFGSEEIEVRDSKGNIIPLWVDGKNIDLKLNRERLDCIRRACEKADAVSVTTPILAKVYSEYNDNVYKLPNCVNLDLWKHLNFKRDNPDEIRLYWSGGSSHFEDLMLLRDVLPVIANKYKNTKLVLMGCNFKAATKGFPEDRVEFHNWVPTPAYPYKTAILDADISLIPLDDNAFSNCKSNIKWVEQSALFVPSVVSLVSPYKEAYNGANGVFVENNSVDGWIAGISHLIDNQVDRWKIGGEARKTVEENYDINKEVVRWYNAYQEIVYGN
jgi:glycosyltransferase involved in cell wall biosynthesis